MKKNFFAVIAIIIAVSTSAFTMIKRDVSDLVWFEVDASTGMAISPSDGVQGDNPPISCPSGADHCATALKISQGEVNNNGDGTFTIASGVNITSPTYYDDTRSKN